MELAVLKATVEPMRQKYAFSERRACGLMMLAVTTYRYRSQRSDEPLRGRRSKCYGAQAPGRPKTTCRVSTFTWLFVKVPVTTELAFVRA